MRFKLLRVVGRRIAFQLYLSTVAIGFAIGILVSLTVNLTSEEVAQIKVVTRLKDDSAAVTREVTEYLRLCKLRELKSVCGKVDYDDQLTRLASLEFDEIGFPT